MLAGADCINKSTACNALLATLPPDRSLRIEKVAEFYDLPVPYLRKHFQDLARAGVLETTPGPKGGYRLARAAASTTLLQIIKPWKAQSRHFAAAKSGEMGPLHAGRNCTLWLAIS